MTEAHKVRSPEHVVESGLDREGRRELCKLLGDALASTYVLYHKTHAYHWNVTGPLFYSIHKLTDKQYNNMAKAIDAIAERIRALGLDCGPMSGFDQKGVNEAFFSGTDVVSNWICNIGYGTDDDLFERSPRLSFEEAAELL